MMSEQVVKSKDIKRQTRKLQGIDGHFLLTEWEMLSKKQEVYG